MHRWGDGWFIIYGQDFNKAIRFFTSFNKRCGGYKYFFTKEKYGTMRLEGFCLPLSRWKRFVFNCAILITLYKWPQFKEELTDDYEFDEVLYSWVKKKIKYKTNWVVWPYSDIDSTRGDNSVDTESK